MKKLMLSAAVLGLAATAMAEYQIDFDPTMLPAGHGYPSCSAMIGFVPASYSAVMSGPSGFPEMYHAVWTNDDQILTPSPIASITMTFECDGQMVSYTSTFAPFSTFYIPGPANPPENPTNFGVDASGNCLPDPPVGTEDLPVAFNLADAFPNPFNPSTTINFALPQAELVKLNVFNITGQKVATLANEMMVRGNHEVTFDASALSSGVYMYTIEAGNFTATKKMVLVK